MSGESVVIDRAATAREIVDALDVWAKNAVGTHADEVTALWMFLAALRGPDEQSARESKHLTAEYLRAPLYNMAEYSGANALPVPALTPLSRDRIIAWVKEEYEASGNWHFRSHVARALKALMHMGYVPFAEVPNDL